MRQTEYMKIISDSQQFMKKLFDEIFEQADEQISVNTPEDVEDMIISLYEREVYDCVEVKIDTDAQTGFFTITQSINSTSYFWHFLENIVNGAEVSYWYQDQEGPDAGIVARKIDDDYLRITLLSDGWWEFYKGKRGLKQISYDEPVISLDMICLKQEFITKIYALMKSIIYPKSGKNDYDPWYDEPRDSEIVKKYAEGSVQKVVCPYCGSERIAEYLYGLYGDDDELMKAAENGEVIFAGCIVTIPNQDPDYRCRDCGKDFGGNLKKMMVSEDKVLEFAKESHYEGIKYLGAWYGYHAYEALPTTDPDVIVDVGFPQFILVQEDEIRFADDKEGHQIFYDFDTEEDDEEDEI